MRQLLRRVSAGSRIFLAARGQAASAVRLRHRIVCGILAGAWIGCFAWWGLAASGLGARDFGVALRDARALVDRRDPYAVPVGFDWVLYPLTAALFALPFVGLSPPVAGGLFAGISAGLLVFAVLRDGWNRLLIVLSYPFWSAVVTVQWSPLLMAAASLPWLFPVVIAKPNLGLPVALRSATRAGIGAAAALTLITIVWVPGWPAAWWRGMAGYQSFVPVASGAGCLLLLALARHRDKDARFLVLMSAIPQRWFYDALPLWLIPSTTGELLSTSLISWGALLFTPERRTIRQVALLSAIFNYLPMLVVVWTRPWRRLESTRREARSAGDAGSSSEARAPQPGSVP
ncbi:MAG: hypothetical protein LAP87_04440 [Acidobacteriia bacterium]|nr:hypothetical protein [Terriglobia bacterium]